MKVFIDPGHGGGDPGAVANGIQEKVINLTVSKKLKELLQLSDIEVKMSRETDVGVDLSERCTMANKWGADFFISVHHNAGGGDGYEVIHSIYHGKGEQLANEVGKEFDKTGQNCRRIFSRQGQNGDYYCVIRETSMPAIITEYAFLDSKDVEAVDTTEELHKEATAIAKGVCDYVGIKLVESKPQPKPADSGMLILGKPSSTIGQAKEWARKSGATSLFISLADIYWKVAPGSGVDPAVAFAQAAKETGFGKFGGVLDESFKNPCGMKKKEGGSDSDKNAHQKFASWEEGITAHVDHLALYAGASGYPKSLTPDPRHFGFIAGTAKTVESLGGKWAPAPSYGNDIVKMVSVVKATDEPPVKTVQETVVEDAISNKLITDKQYWLDVLNGKTSPNPEYIQIIFQRAGNEIKKAKEGAK